MERFLFKFSEDREKTLPNYWDRDMLMEFAWVIPSLNTYFVVSDMSDLNDLNWAVWNKDVTWR